MKKPHFKEADCYIKFENKQAQEGNSRVRLEMTNKRARTCLNVKNVKEMLKTVKDC